jgi:WD40 repeat protein
MKNFFARFYWLEITEYITILLSIFGLFFFLHSGKNIWFLSFLLISLILNAVNRIRLEIRTRSRIAAALKLQLRKFTGEIEGIKQKLTAKSRGAEQLQPPQRRSNMGQLSDNVVINALQEDLDSLEKSITGIIQYINSYMLDKRMKMLEESNQKIRKEIEHIYQRINPHQTETLPKQSLPPNLPKNDAIESPPTRAWKCLQIIEGHSQSVTGLAISYDAKYLLSISWDQTLKLWSLEDGNLIDSFLASEQGLLAVTLNKFSLADPNSHQYCLATGSFDQKIKICSLVRDKQDKLTINLEHTITGHTGSIHSLAIASKQKILVSGSYDQTVKQWNLETGEMLESSYDESGSIYAIALHEQGEFIASGGGDGRITILELGGAKRLGLLTGNLTSVESLAISPSGEIVAAGCVDGTIKLWYLEPDIFASPREINPSLVFQGHHGQVMSLVFNPDGQILYSSAVDGQIKLWFPSTGKELGHLKISEDNRVFSLALSSDGKILAAGGIDGTIKIWQQN